MTRTTPPPTWGRAFNRALRHGADLTTAAVYAEGQVTTTMHYRAGDYLALCGIHRPEDMLTDDRAAVTCARCRSRVNFPQDTGPTITPLPSEPPRPQVIWWDCGCEIACLCGAAGLIVNDETPATCDECGRVWSLHTRLDCKEAQL